ncbi:MAG: 4Fe-4S dicluster domain-containing protein [Alphaproteobacteria bacterium]|nr:4Fe-4S dicluster domain-containing protein [Alphaproteobacteria bacterium]
MNRRNFLKALGLGGSASALSACGLDDNRYYTPVEQILPYVVKPESVTPGTPTFFATTITRGPEAHPVLAKHRDGRVVHVGANTRSPWMASIPKGAMLELQKHYSPDRFKGPQANGNSGSTVSWEDGVKQVVDAVAAAKQSGKKIAWLGAYRSGSYASIIASICDTAVFWEPMGYEAEANAAEALFGTRMIPRYDLDDAKYVLSFGADFLNSWGGNRVAGGWSKARSHTHGHHVARFALVSPYRDQTGANADDWYAVKPGSQALVARAVARIVATKTGYAGPALAALGNVDTAAAASAAGIEAAQIEEIAAHFAAGDAVALPGGPAGASGSATELAAATFLLNIVAGSAPKLFSAGGYMAPVGNAADVQALVAALESGSVGVLFVDDCNPVHALPNVNVKDAIAKAGLSVAFTSHPDETTDACKLILPAADAFEDWGDEQPVAGVTLLRQPTMSPLQIRYRPPGAEERVEDGWDVRSAGEVLVAAGRALGVVTQNDWRGYLHARWGMVYKALVLDAATDEAPADDAAAMAPEKDAGFAAWLAGRLQEGFVATTTAMMAPTVTGSIPWQDATPPAGAGQYNLHVTPHAHIRDGRYANSPWAQELPDPMTGQVWDSWVEIHPETAKSLGVSDNSKVTLKSDAGSVDLGVEVTTSVRPDTVAVQLGQGHTNNGRYASNIGVNVAALVGAAKDPQGAMAWQSAKVSVTPSGGKADLISTFGGDTDENRNFAVHVNAKQFGENGDAPQAHGGELTGIHHLELDKRLVENGITDFYSLTQHPTYRFGLTVDTDACNGCGACSIACYAENNLPIVGKEKIKEGREMSWIRVNRYFKGDETHFVPMMCQHCGHAPCESVCPVLATYHNLDGLNAMVYNRCVGTRYCSNACPFSARKFNYHTYVWPEPFNMQLNPDVVTRTMGVMEKCSFCVQRLRAVKSAYKDEAASTEYNAKVPDSALTRLVACAEACPTHALTFGNLNTEDGALNTARKSSRNYMPLDDLNVMSAVNYLAKVSFHAPEAGHHGGGHGGDAGHAGEAGDGHGGSDHGEEKKHDEHGGDAH